METPARGLKIDSYQVGHEGQSPLSQNGEPRKPTHYEVLNVDPSATRLEIREAYLRLKAAYDHGSQALYSLIPDDEARALLGEMELAFQVLTDDVARRSYDLALGFSSPQPPQMQTVGYQHTETPVNTERLYYAQETLRAERLASFGTRDFEAKGRFDSPPSRDLSPTVIQTTRQHLPVVKLKAEKCEDHTLAEKMTALIEASDLSDGELYKKLRELAGVSQDEMQDRTKISVGYLLALESNRMDRLPQAVYVKGFLRSYFRYIGAPKAEEMVHAFSSKLSDFQSGVRT